MKKILEKLNFKTIAPFMVGVIVFAGITTVAAGAIFASQVTYTKNGQSTVDGAIDTLYTRVNTTITNLQSQITTLQQQLAAAPTRSQFEVAMCPGCVYRKSSTRKYNVNISTDSGRTEENSKLEPGEYTTDYTTLNSLNFLGHVLDSNGYILASYACGIKNGTLFCLRGIDSNQPELIVKSFYEEAVSRINEFFSDGGETYRGWGAGETSSETDDLYVEADSNGTVDVWARMNECIVAFNGSSHCID